VVWEKNILLPEAANAGGPGVRQKFHFEIHGGGGTGRTCAPKVKCTGTMRGGERGVSQTAFGKKGENIQIVLGVERVGGKGGGKKKQAWQESCWEVGKNPLKQANPRSVLIWRRNGS